MEKLADELVRINNKISVTMHKEGVGGSGQHNGLHLHVKDGDETAEYILDTPYSGHWKPLNPKLDSKLMKSIENFLIDNREGLLTWMNDMSLNNIIITHPFLKPHNNDRIKMGNKVKLQ